MTDNSVRLQERQGLGVAAAQPGSTPSGQAPTGLVGFAGTIPNAAERLARVIYASDQSSIELPFERLSIEAKDNLFDTAEACLVEMEHGLPAHDGSFRCDECGRLNPVWFAPNAVWNMAVGGTSASDDPCGMLCPICFIAKAEAAGIKPNAWLVTPDAPSVAEALQIIADWPDDGFDRSTAGDMRSLARSVIRAAQGMSAGTAETAQQAQGEARQSGGEAMRPTGSGS